MYVLGATVKGQGLGFGFRFSVLCCFTVRPPFERSVSVDDHTCTWYCTWANLIFIIQKLMTIVHDNFLVLEHHTHHDND